MERLPPFYIDNRMLMEQQPNEKQILSKEDK
jgi:hypothetical protein